MSIEDDFTKRVEMLAAAMGIECLCRKMHVTPMEGEDFEPYDEYDTRARTPGGFRQVVLDEQLATMHSEAIDELIRLELEHLRP